MRDEDTVGLEVLDDGSANVAAYGSGLQSTTRNLSSASPWVRVTEHEGKMGDRLLDLHASQGEEAWKSSQGSTLLQVYWV